MKPCPPPDGSHLSPDHRPFLASVLQLLAANGFLRSKLNPLLADIVKAFPGGDAELSDWCDELEQWVRWYRVPAYWLGFILQLVTQARGSIWHFRACALYADAQTSFADDYALSSLEVAYTDYARNQGALGPAFAPVRDALARRLLFYYTHYYTWSRPFEYMAGNPCADHLYTSLSHAWLEADTTDDDQPFDARNAEALSRIVREAGGDAFAFHRIVARRFLGLLHGGRGRHDLAAEHYHDALEEARRVQLDTEIGHLTRLLGGALRELGDLTEARHQFEQALAYEQLQPVAMYTMFWQALSASELGNTIVRAAGRPVVDTAVAAGQTAVRIDQPQVALEPALRAFRAARSLLSRHMSGQAPVPVARAGKQATFRSFSTNAIQAAALSQSVSDILGEVEVAGPRGVTELVAETSAVEEMNSDSLAAFRRNRAMYYSTLSTMPASFEEYLSDIVAHSAERRAYLKMVGAITGPVAQALSPDLIVQRALNLKLPRTVFLLLHVGERMSQVVILDLESSTVAPFAAKFGERDLRTIHEEYLATASNPETRRLALDALGTRYNELLGPVLERLLPFLPGRHLKIFPRLQMNGAALHALRFEGKYLLEHCDAISYGQTLGLFLENHASRTAPPPPVHAPALRMVMGDDVGWYDRILPRVRTAYGESCVVDQAGSWPQLVDSLRRTPARDTVFACHGEFDPDNLDGSWLRLARGREDGQVLFSRVFADLDLSSCRSVMMGACDSGLARAEVGAEYIGLPSAMLSSGVRYVVGALWTIPELATAVLVDHYLKIISNPSAGVCRALCDAQRIVMRLTRDALVDWIQEVVSPGAELDDLMTRILGLPPQPFAHPYYWAGLHVVGDV